MRTTFVILTAFELIGTTGALSSARQPQTVSTGIYTAEQAKRGAAAYQKSCSLCHLEDLSGDQFATPLIGETFTQRWQDSTVGDLFAILKATMPANNPGTLTDEIYVDLVAYLLMMNKYPDGREELRHEARELSKIRFKNP